MKKIVSLALAVMMLVSVVPMVYAAETDYSNGTNVTYNAEDPNGDGQPDHFEAYTVTVPAELAPGETGDVHVYGTWASNKTLFVSADKTVTLTNSINALDTKTLNIDFYGIALQGSNTSDVTNVNYDGQGSLIHVGEIENALFGTWSGHFNYYVELSSRVTFKIGSTTFQAEEGMTWGEWVTSEFNGDESFVVSEDNIMSSISYALVGLNGEAVSLTDTIVAGATYYSNL